MKPTSLSFAVLLASGVALSGVGGCGSDASTPPGSSVTGGNGGGGSGGSAGTGAAPGGGSGGGVIDSGLTDGPTADANCGIVTEKANSTPLHLYVMMDKSSSMAGNQWDAATAGLTAFVKDANSAGVSVGLNFFPRDPDGTPACDQKAYSTPKVPFDFLPKNETAIVAGLNAESPSGLSTPTWPALGGAILKGIEIAQNNPGHTAAVLLVTDGVPQGPAATCSGVNPEDFGEIAKLAATGAGFTPPVLTYVIGLPGVNQTFANQVAASGGTTSAILVSNTNVQKEFQTALEKVRGQALPCEYELPEKVDKGEFAPDKVNVELTPGTGPTTTIPQTPDCNQGAGWYYDDPVKPTKIVLCPSVCDGIKKDFGAKIDILLGCPTQVVK